ncbi:MAG: TnpV protein, partial [Clostridia bacterium]|nr:TnpV protein [Clostridia bacterium]
SVYNEFLVSGKLQTYLAQIDRDAQEMFDLLVRQLAEQESITEQLKSEDQMEWVQCMNSIQNRATEIVNHELIYV